MKPLAAPVAPVQTRDWNPSVSARGVLHALARGLARAIATAQVYLAYHRDARVAEELYRHLRRLSDAELARRGLSRDQIAQFVKQGF